jgi:small ubiquitin-related modifier
VAASSSDGALQVGDRIECRHGGGPKFFPGSVQAASADGATFDVLYDDGDVEAKAPRYRIKRDGEKEPRDLRAGVPVDVRHGGGKTLFPAKIGAVADAAANTYDVVYDDGDKETKVPRKFIMAQCLSPAESKATAVAADAAATMAKAEAEATANAKAEAKEAAVVQALVGKAAALCPEACTPGAMSAQQSSFCRMPVEVISAISTFFFGAWELSPAALFALRSTCQHFHATVLVSCDCQPQRECAKPGCSVKRAGMSRCQHCDVPFYCSLACCEADRERHGAVCDYVRALATCTELWKPRPHSVASAELVRVFVNTVNTFAPSDIGSSSPGSRALVDAFEREKCGGILLPEDLKLVLSLDDYVGVWAWMQTLVNPKGVLNSPMVVYCLQPLECKAAVEMPSTNKAEAQAPRDTLTLCVRDVATGEETLFKVRYSTAMDKIFTAYATRKGVDKAVLLFQTDSRRVPGNATPELLGLKDADRIDVLEARSYSLEPPAMWSREEVLARYLRANPSRRDIYSSAGEDAVMAELNGKAFMPIMLDAPLDRPIGAYRTQWYAVWDPAEQVSECMIWRSTVTGVWTKTCPLAQFMLTELQSIPPADAKTELTWQNSVDKHFAELDSGKPDLLLKTVQEAGSARDAGDYPRAKGMLANFIILCKRKCDHARLPPLQRQLRPQAPAAAKMAATKCKSCGKCILPQEYYHNAPGSL